LSTGIVGAGSRLLSGRGEKRIERKEKLLIRGCSRQIFLF
jgi:hypothetical protein